MGGRRACDLSVALRCSMGMRWIGYSGRMVLRGECKLTVGMRCVWGGGVCSCDRLQSVFEA